jgi:hypothetical protein
MDKRGARIPSMRLDVTIMGDRRYFEASTLATPSSEGKRDKAKSAVRTAVGDVKDAVKDTK